MVMNSNPSPDAPTTIRVASWQDVGEAAQAVRQAVFVEEQRLPAALERDPADAGCVHAVAFDAAGQAVGTGRLRPLPDGVMQLGRLAVLRSWRGRGVGQALLQALLEAACARGAREVMLHAQQSAASFYLDAGFELRGEEFVEAGIAHQEMVLRLGEGG